MKSYGDEFTDFYDREIPKVDSNHSCLAVISLDSALKKDEDYYAQVFLKECKYIEKKVSWHINDNWSDFSYSDFTYSYFLILIFPISTRKRYADKKA